MIDFNQLPLTANVALFAAAAATIAVAGWSLAIVADRLADRTGLGEAVAGAVFLGATTSLSGSIASFTAALDGHAEFAVSNGLGGIAAQTAFIAVADVSYRKANLEHAAASLTNIMQGSLLVAMLSLVLVALVAPPVSVAGIHPVSLLLVAGYLYGMRLVYAVHRRPMWRPTATAQTRRDQPDRDAQRSALAPMLLRFAALALLVAGTGWLIARSGVAISRQTGLTESAVGGVFTALSTSLPELVTMLSAVRHGALTLAVGDIIGGNVFDTLFVALADAAYRDGSILHAAAPQPLLLILAVSLLQAGILLTALIRRQERGVAGVGVDSIVLLLLYGLLAVLLVTA